MYDWDSVAVASEPVLVGSVAAQFTADWGTESADPLPSLSEMRAFVDDYERARGRGFTEEEGALMEAANLFACAYGARCEHSDRLLRPDLVRGDPPPWLRLLTARAERSLAAGVRANPMHDDRLP